MPCSDLRHLQEPSHKYIIKGQCQHCLENWGGGTDRQGDGSEDRSDCCERPEFKSQDTCKSQIQKRSSVISTSVLRRKVRDRGTFQKLTHRPAWSTAVGERTREMLLWCG